MIILLCAVIAVVFAVSAFVSTPPFGRLPRGKRLERIENSPNYRDGQFQNRHSSPMIVGNKGFVSNLIDFLFRKSEDVRPAGDVPAVKTDLRTLDPQKELMVWFGHSSYLIQSGGRRILVDPVFVSASPVSWFNKPFGGTDIYKPGDMPAIDYLVISHDHWDHLDYLTVRELKTRVRFVVCPLGVGEHFERWGFSPERIIELDWGERATPDMDVTISCLPARHFSGRGLSRNKTLWASFMFKTAAKQIYLAGDGGYDTHFAEIGQKFGEIDLAVLENGQYNERWRYIHTLPVQLRREAEELGAKCVATVHHSKYALALHAWDEPLRNAEELAAGEPSIKVLRPEIGEVVEI